jgi:hypothetical protein
MEQTSSRSATRAVDSGTQAGIQVPVIDLRSIEILIVDDALQYNALLCIVSSEATSNSKEKGVDLLRYILVTLAQPWGRLIAASRSEVKFQY